MRAAAAETNEILIRITADQHGHFLVFHVESLLTRIAQGDASDAAHGEVLFIPGIHPLRGLVFQRGPHGRNAENSSQRKGHASADKPCRALKEGAAFGLMAVTGAGVLLLRFGFGLRWSQLGGMRWQWLDIFEVF